MTGGCKRLSLSFPTCSVRKATFHSVCLVDDCCELYELSASINLSFISIKPVTSGENYAHHSNNQCAVWAWIFCPDKIKSDVRSNLHVTTTEDLIHISMEGPELVAFDPTLDSWKVVKQWPEIKAFSLGLQNVARRISSVYFLFYLAISTIYITTFMELLTLLTAYATYGTYTYTTYITYNTICIFPPLAILILTLLTIHHN